MNTNIVMTAMSGWNKVRQSPADTSLASSAIGERKNKASVNAYSQPIIIMEPEAQASTTLR